MIEEVKNAFFSRPILSFGSATKLDLLTAKLHPIHSKVNIKNKLRNVLKFVIILVILICSLAL